MKLSPGDIILDKERVLTVLSVIPTVRLSYGTFKQENDLLTLMDSTKTQSATELVWETEIDSWHGIQVLRAKKE